ncbi:unnamed protein product, partial [Meganyctiphanes norvegica]
QCNFPHCNNFKTTLTHMRTCSIGRSCPEQHCFSSRQIIYHWKMCGKQSCEVCGTIKPPYRHQQPVQITGPVPQSYPSQSGTMGFSKEQADIELFILTFTERLSI